MTSIEWTAGDDGSEGKTWNPIRGCDEVSPGCRNCYAKMTAARFCGPGQPFDGLVQISKKADGKRVVHWTGVTRFVPEKLDEPMRWKKPHRVFVNSMSDLFHDGFTNEEIAAIFGVMAACPQHTFQVLTKRAQRMREWFEWLEQKADEDGEEWCGRDCNTTIHDARDACRWEFLDENACSYIAACHLGIADHRPSWPLPNVWLGVSVENQAAADERIPELLATPAAVRFLSCEPLLGPVQLPMVHVFGTEPKWDGPRLGWVIAGCESGAGARRCDVDWLRSLRDQCAQAEVPFFLKQAKSENDGSLAILHEGPGSKRKPGGIIGSPYLDDVQHLAFPAPQGGR